MAIFTISPQITYVYTDGQPSEYVKNMTSRGKKEIGASSIAFERKIPRVRTILMRARNLFDVNFNGVHIK